MSLGWKILSHEVEPGGRSVECLIKYDNDKMPMTQYMTIEAFRVKQITTRLHEQYGITTTDLNIFENAVRNEANRDLYDEERY